MKFDSGKLRSQKYNITTDFEESKRLGEIVALGDSQVLRSIRDIRRRTVIPERVERLFLERKLLRRRLAKGRIPYKTQLQYEERLKAVQKRIEDTMYMDDYITVTMDHNAHYNNLFKNGFLVNGKKYVRLSCSAGQARASTVVFCASDIIEELDRRLNNGRDMTKKIAPSKYNAYYGLYTSATRLVSEPRIAVVRDFENTSTFMANFVTETDWDIDDDIEVREVTVPMKRTDGMGLISPQLAAKWAEELELGYVPSQWVIRQSFLKGMVCTFDFHAFCDEINGGQYVVDTVYTGSDGQPVKVDLRDVDMIVSESQFKLWDHFESLEQYVQNLHKNKLYWGVTIVSPEVPKDSLRLNYQFIQTLNLKQADVEELCEAFVDWIERVSYKDPTYMLLFLLGRDGIKQDIARILSAPDKAWIKALYVNRNCANDSYIKAKIRELVRSRIENGRMGEVLVKGNFQMLVGDPYAYMQHVCGLPVTGLLGEHEYYCNYWNERGVDVVDSMRSPMTYRSEHVVANLKKNDLTEKWFKHCKGGFVVNWFGNDCVRYSGADEDGDLVASTDNAAMVRCVYSDELPVVYDAPKAVKKLCTQNDLFVSDKFGFGSKIGAITNKGTTAYALLPLLEQRYGRDSEQVKITESRLKQCCVAQSREIDKCKLGQAVKCIPKLWTRWQHGSEEETEQERERREIYNSCLLNKRPYFFRYRYAEDKRKYKDYYAEKNSICRSRFGLTVRELQSKVDKTTEQEEWLWKYYDFSPLVESDSPMNLLCRYLEGINFRIQSKVRATDGFDPCEYMSDGNEWEDCYNEVAACFQRFWRDARWEKETYDQERLAKAKLRNMRSLERQLSMINSSHRVIADALVWYCYIAHPAAKKDALWYLYGSILVANAERRAKERGDKIFVPVACDHASATTEYLGKPYCMKEVDNIDDDFGSEVPTENFGEEDLL